MAVQTLGRPARPFPPPVHPPNSEQARWFTEEVQPHEPRLRARLRVLFPTLADTDADDVMQETYLRLFRARAKGGVRSVRAFLFMAANNAACDFFRRQKSHVVERVENVADLEVLEMEPDAADVAASRQELDILADAIRELPDRCREVFTLRKIYGLSQREIAIRLGISEHTVEAQVCKGARRCAVFLRSRGVFRQ